MPGITRAQAEALYDAFRRENRDKAMTAAEAINPRLRADLEQDPQAVLDVTAGMLDWPSWGVRPDMFRRAEGPAESGLRELSLADIASVAVPLGGGLAAERAGMRVAAPAINRLLATSPRLRLLATRAVQGLLGGGGAGVTEAVPEAIRERSIEPLVSGGARGAGYGAALTPGATLVRRAIPFVGGGALRTAAQQADELAQFRQLMTPVRQALAPVPRGTVPPGAGPQTAVAPPAVQMTPAVRGALETGGLAPPARMTAVHGRGIQQLEQAVGQAERDVGMGLRPATMRPAEAATTGAAAKDAVDDLLGQMDAIGGGPAPGSREALRAAQQQSTEALTGLRQAQTARTTPFPGQLPPGTAPQDVIEHQGMLYVQAPEGNWVRLGRAPARRIGRQ
jgi:hypothetical protein